MIPSRGLYARGRVRYILDAATVTSTASEAPPLTQDPQFTTAEVAVNWFKDLGSRWRSKSGRWRHRLRRLTAAAE